MAGGCLVCAETMVIACACDGYAEKILVFVDRLDDRREEQKELRVLIRGFAGFQKVDARVRGNGPVVVFTASVNACKRFLMKQTHETVF